ncbi:MAG: right-handed parallel beta-helix repeat-containing protein [Actinomycetota bacterium]
MFVGFVAVGLLLIGAAVVLVGRSGSDGSDEVTADRRAAGAPAAAESSGDGDGAEEADGGQTAGGGLALEVESDLLDESVRGFGRLGVAIGQRSGALSDGPVEQTGSDGSAQPDPAGPVLAARALFVDGTRPDGPHLGTIAAPFHRPIDALNVVEPGTTIYLRGGVYNLETHGSNILRRSGTPDAWIHIRPYPGEAVEIISGGEWGNGFEFQGSAYATIAGFTFTGRDDSIHGSGVFGKDGSHDIVVSDNYIEGFGGAGVSFVRSSRITVERNEVRNNAARSFFQGSGISLFEAEGPLRPNGGYANVIRANHVVGNYNGVPSREGRLTDGNCIIIDFFNETNYQGSTLVENNVCVENGGRGVHVFYSSNVVARNNTLIRNGWSADLFGGRAEMVAARGENISFYNNLVINRENVAAILNSRAEGVYVNNLVASGPPDGDGNGLLPAEGALLGATEAGASLEQFRPLSSSVLIGAGRPDLQSPIDALGERRPRRGTIGALEPAFATAGP